MYRAGFVIEQTLGHITHGQNLQQYISQDPSLEAHWGFPVWDQRRWPARLPLIGRNWTVQAGWQARRLVAGLHRQARLQALFFHTQVTAVLARDWLRRLPSIISLDATPRQIDSLGTFYRHAIGPAWWERVKWQLNCEAFARAAGLVTWSAWAKQGLIDEYGVPASKVTVIPPGVDTQAWSAPVRPARTGQPVKILFVGAALERKGGLVLLEAFRHLRARRADGPPAAAVELHLVTKTAVAPEPGVCVYNALEPNSPALRRLFHDCDIFCLPTLGDCLPVALAEAGAAGLPLVATQVAAIPEIVQDGHTGRLVPAGEAQPLVAALEWLAANAPLRRELGANAQRLVRRQFDAATNARRLTTLMKEMIDASAASRRRR